MTYVNKKIRVFLDANEKDATQVRAEGQMKSYVSATDARVWCDFIEERRQQILEYQAKCRTGMCPGKLIPIEDLLHLLSGEKEKELGDLRKRVEFLEKLIEIYDNLPLTNEQKCKLDAGKKKLEAQYKEKACKSPCASGKDPNPPCDGSCALEDGQSTLCEEKSCSASCVGDGAFFTPPESSVNVDKPSKPNGKPSPGEKPSSGSGACPWVPTCKDTCRFPCKDGIKKGSTANGNDKKRGSVDKKSTDTKSIDKGVNVELGPCKDACIDTCTAPCKSAIKNGSKNKSSGANRQGSKDMSVQRSSVTINDSCRCIEFKNKPNSNYVCKGPCSRH